MTTNQSPWRGRRCHDCGISVCAERAFGHYYFPLCGRCFRAFNDEMFQIVEAAREEYDAVSAAERIVEGGDA